MRLRLGLLDSPHAGAGPATYGGGVSSSQMIDWNVAASTASRWVRPGPQVGLTEARKVVAELREQAAAVAEPVRDVTGLPGDGDGGKVAVVDRPGWIKANITGFEVVLDPLVEHMQDIGAAPSAGSVLTAVGSRVTGMQAGLILAYLASRVLGQYELFLPPDPDRPADEAPAGRLTLVAPNIVMVERELGVDPSDFRRWVCLNEEMQSQRQREILDRLTAVMTLVEGHGDYVMDAVGPAVVPSVEEIRAKFNARRTSGNRIEQAVRRILGIDLKMRQYQQGAAFVRTVVDEAGMETFNRVWTSPETLPAKEELTNPLGWLERVAGTGALPRLPGPAGPDDARADGPGADGARTDGAGADGAERQA